MPFLFTSTFFPKEKNKKRDVPLTGAYHCLPHCHDRVCKWLVRLSLCLIGVVCSQGVLPQVHLPAGPALLRHPCLLQLGIGQGQQRAGQGTGQKVSSTISEHFHLMFFLKTNDLKALNFGKACLFAIESYISSQLLSFEIIMLCQNLNRSI